jgi:pimeloyl-ACP methyl ester carboxylesterase/acyl-CoA thioesterase FadM
VLENLPGYTPYSLQLPWRGGNSYLWRPDGSPAEWLARALKLVPEQPVVLLGHSFGANAILEYLSTMDGQEGLSSVVLAAPFYRPADYPIAEGTRSRSLAAFRRVLADGLTLSLGTRAKRIDPEIKAGMTAKLLDRAVPAGFPVFLDEFVNSGLLDLTGITVPTLVLAGTKDEGFTPLRAEAFGRAMPAATVRLKPSYGHFFHIAQADSLSKEIDGFLRREAPSEGGHAMTDLLDGEPTSYVSTPRYEGANIRTWIGFKHFMYLCEEAILQYFRDRGVGARTLYHRYGLGLEIVDSSCQLPVALEVDEQVYATVVSAKPKPGLGAPFTVELTVERDGKNVTASKAKVRVALVRVKDGSGSEPIPDMVAQYVVSEVDAMPNAENATLAVDGNQTVEDVLAPEGSNAYLWSWRAPYFYCHFSDRLQHSAYVRTMEEVVDRFLHDRELAIGKLLDERSWIPVVSRARVQMLADVYMEETVHTVFTVEDILKDMMYTARMDCYVRRGDKLVRTATGSIMHGYAISRGPEAGTVPILDPTTKAALLGTEIAK